MDKKDQGKSSLGMDANTAATLSYVAGFITGIIFYVLEKDNKFVKFHAMQSIVVFGAITVLFYLLPILGTLGYHLFGLVRLLGLVLWIILLIKAYQGEKFKLPIIGDFAESKS